MRRAGARAALVALGLLSTVSGGAGTASPSRLTGTVAYRERIALPPSAVLEVTLEEVSRADAPAEVIARVRRESPGQVPLQFSLGYDPARLRAAHRYALRARISAGGELMFVTDTNYPVLAPGQSDHVDMIVRRVPGGASDAGKSAARRNEPPTDDIPGLPASYEGDLPCADCEGLRYRLDLYANGLFALRRSYLGRPPATMTDEIGRWRFSARSRTLRLENGRGGAEQFAMRDAHTLAKLDMAGRPIASVHNDELRRMPVFSPLEPVLRLRGKYRYMADAGLFEDCASGIRFPVATEADNARLEAAYAASRGEPGAERIVTLDGRIAQRVPMEGPGPRPTLVVDRFTSISSAQSCVAPARAATLENASWKPTPFESRYLK